MRNKDNKNKVEIWYEQQPISVFLDDEYFYPMVIDGGRGLFIDTSEGDILNFLTYDALTYDEKYKYHIKIAEMTENGIYSFDYDEIENTDDIVEQVEEMLYDWIGEHVGNMETFCKEFGIKHFYKESIGYSQGDVADIIIIPIPTKDTLSEYESITTTELERQFKLTGFYLWGDVYRLEITREDGEFVDQFGGYATDDREELYKMIMQDVDPLEYGFSEEEFKDIVLNSEFLFD